MSTNNFGFTNILYAVNSTYYTDQETGQECQDEFIFDDTISNIKYEIKDKANWFWDDEPKYYHKGYNSGVTVHARADAYFAAINQYSSALSGYVKSEATITVSLTSSSGYYDGFCFDYIIDYDGEEFTQKEWDIKILDPMFHFSMSRTEGRKADAFITRNVKAAKIAQLSDGSAIYSII
jgi:hypothetical protein